MSCPTCGFVSRSSAVFCGRCGGPLSDPAAANAAGDGLSIVPWNKGQRRARIAAVLVMDAALLATGGHFTALARAHLRVTAVPPRRVASVAALPRNAEPERAATVDPMPEPSAPTVPIVPPPPPRSVPPARVARSPSARATARSMKPSVGVPAPEPPRSEPQPSPLTTAVPAAPGPAEPAPAPPAPRLAAASQDPPDDEALVRAAVRDRLAEVRGCYARVQGAGPTGTELHEGTVEIAFTIERDGSTEGAHALTNTTGAEALATCVSQLVAGWRFPGLAAAPLDFIYPFRFKAKEESPP